MRAALVIQAVVSAALVSGCTSSPTDVSIPDQTTLKLTVAPSTATIGGGFQLQLRATAKNAEGERLVSEGVTWRSLNQNVAAVDAGGLVHGIEPGQTLILARWGDARGSASITVVLPTQVGPGSCAELALGRSALLGGKKTACQ